MTNKKEVRTPEEIEALKVSWAKDPCWDIEGTKGFEAHYEELKAWREERERQFEIKFREAEEERIEKVAGETGVGKAYRAELLALQTYSEIEEDVRRIEQRFEDPNVLITSALVRATLLQGAQLKRIADSLEAMQDSDSIAASVRIWGSK